MKSNSIFFFLLVILSFLFFSCNDKIEMKDENQEPNLVSVAEVKELATSIFTPNHRDTISPEKRSSAYQKKVKSIKTFFDETQKAVFYFVNYDGGGFVIISADNRAMPILAYSEMSDLPLDEKAFPTGLMDWMTYAKSYIGEIRKNNQKQTENESKMWSNYAVSRSAPPDDPCQDSYENIGPLLQSTWGQGCGYNNLMQYCNDWSYCYRAPTGCVATAMAQVMRYHKFPTSYNWSIMPNAVLGSSDVGSSEISQLMSDIGVKVGMKYTCDGSSADTKAKVASAFVNGFGYSSARYVDYAGTSNYNAVQNELRNRRPVIFRGGENVGWWIFGKYGNGHAWVCDGFSQAFFCETGTTHLYLHMNWGWNGSYNGYYAFNNFNPGSYTFNYKSGVVINIKP